MRLVRAARALVFAVGLILVAAACDPGDQAVSPPPEAATTQTSQQPKPGSTTTTAVADPIGITAPVVRLPARGEFIYFVLTDRFENADPSNDTGGLGTGTADADSLRHGYLPTDPGFYHGGDIAGLQQRLDYLVGLGVTAVWVTPPFTNRVVQGNGTVGGSSAGYHGYWQVDFTNIDPHLGSNAEMKAFVDTAHDSGLRVYFDAVLNHTGDVISYAEDSVAYRPKQGWPYMDASGEPFDDSEFAGDTDFPELDPTGSFAYTPAFADESDANLKGPAWLNDPIYYHNRGNSTFSGESSLYGDFFGLDDLFTEHPDVVAGMTGVYRSVIEEFGVDGFRVDTVKHVNDEFWDSFLRDVNESAGVAGDDDLFVFGEVFSSDPLLRSHYTTNLAFPSVLDFGFSDAAISYVADGASAELLADLFEDDDWFTDADSSASMLVKFIGNHDMGRLGLFVRTANTGAGDAELLRRMELAMELMFTTRGIPLVYYGDEQGFVGDGGDKGARQDMFPSQVASYNDDDLLGTRATTAESNFDPSHPLYSRIAKLAQLRRDHPTLETGAQINRHAALEAGVYAFSRIDRHDRVEYVVAVNNSTEAQSVEFTVASPGTPFSGIYPTGIGGAASLDNGRLELELPGLSAVVYRADRPVPPSSTAPAIAVTNPVPDADVGFERFRIEAALDRDMYAEVTFAVAVDGAEFEIVGTDDAPPYRVFWDRTHLEAGSHVEVMATVDDLSGHRSVGVSSFTLS